MSKSKYCPNCGKSWKTNFQYCKTCGTELINIRDTSAETPEKLVKFHELKNKPEEIQTQDTILSENSVLSMNEKLNLFERLETLENANRKLTQMVETLTETVNLLTLSKKQQSYTITTLFPLNDEEKARLLEQHQ